MVLLSTFPFDCIFGLAVPASLVKLRADSAKGGKTESESCSKDRATEVKGQGRRREEGEKETQEREAATIELEIVKCSVECGIVTENEGRRKQVKDNE